jgi:ATP-dependent DNA helicase RecQ
MLDELERIVASGTKIDINYYIDEIVEPTHVEEIFEYFREEAETDSIETALEELGSDEYTEQEIRLVRIKFMSDIGN